MTPTTKKQEQPARLYLEATRADGVVVRRVDATGWPEAEVRHTCLAMLLTMDISHVHEVREGGSVVYRPKNGGRAFAKPSILHRLAHLFGWNVGHIVPFRLDEHSYMGLQCDRCGDIESLVHMDGCECWENPEKG